MRKIAEALRLKAAGLYRRGRSRSSLLIGQSTVSEYLKRADRAGLSWPLPTDLTGAGSGCRVLNRLLYAADDEGSPGSGAAGLVGESTAS